MFKLTDSWKWVALLLCVFGFFRELRPSEPFAVEFFINFRNITAEDVTRILYPAGTYSYLAQLVVVFLITDMLRYKAIIVVSAIIGISLFALSLWTTTIFGLILIQICFGSFMAAEVAYYTYIYAKVERDKYQLVTSQTRSAILAGRFLGSVIGQVMISTAVMDYRQLNYLSLGSQCISLVWAILLPSVSASMYFYAKEDVVNDTAKERTAGLENECKGNHVTFVKDSDTNRSLNTMQITTIETTEVGSAMAPANVMPTQTVDKPKFSCQTAVRMLWKHFIMAYSNPTVVVWSIWWAVAMSGFLQVQYYMQLLWKEIYAEETALYNGAVEAAITLLGAIGAFAAGFFDNKTFKRYDMLILTICSAIEGGFLLCAARTNSLMVCYAMYILFGMIYHFMITVASATVAKKLHEDSFALIFGINTLLALIVQSILTYIAISWLALNTRIQYHVYAGYFFTLAIAYGIIYFVKVLIRK